MLISSSGKLRLLTGAIFSIVITGQSHAQNATPALSGEAVMELQNDYTTHSDDLATNEHNTMFLRTEIAPTLRLNDNFFIDGVAVFENIQDREPNEDNYFDNEGLFVEEIKLNYENGAWAAWVGKFNPVFGSAWDFGRGIWGEDFAEDYEITEKIGLGGSYTFENNAIGSHTLAVNTFFADTTFLSGSAITKRDRTHKSDGGISNTENFSSFVISLDGDNLANVENLYYKLGYRNQSNGDADINTHNETGYVTTIGYAFPVTDRIKMDALVEFADIQHFDGGTDDNQYLTTSLITTFDENWNIAVAHTSRDIDVEGNADINDHLLNISGGYNFGQGTTAELGWRSSEESGNDSNIVGGLIRHIFEF